MNKYLISYGSFRFSSYYSDNTIVEWDCISEENIKQFEKDHSFSRIIAITKLDK